MFCFKQQKEAKEGNKDKPVNLWRKQERIREGGKEGGGGGEGGGNKKGIRW